VGNVINGSEFASEHKVGGGGVGILILSGIHRESYGGQFYGTCVMRLLPELYKKLRLQVSVAAFHRVDFGIDTQV
jgi:hypothetical protein